MLQFIRAGGAGMAPVLGCSTLAVIFAVAYLIRPSNRRRVLLVGTSLLTLVSGMMGTFAGIRNSALAASPATGSETLLVEFGQALVVVMYAVGATGLVVLVGTIGSYRAAVEQESSQPGGQS